ncbi:hypothetical protein Tco_0581131 [Tanacetum coccineum]
MDSYIASNDELYKFPMRVTVKHLPLKPTTKPTHLIPALYVDLCCREPEGANVERTRPGCNWHGCSHDLPDVGRKFFHWKDNKDDFRLLRFAHFMLELDGDTYVQKSSMSSDDFDCYPFQFVEFDYLC